ncbi:hypothetical protein K6V78_05240 [Streptococcus gallolyticus]|uniref:hypothetical protein n=1 Tax=Streptococcus hepaticus TaxID=3349163 RepID=UPI001C94D7D4|nr:hypothetical protein [Streptococcus gallolyticus]MBY5041881.1 hypothetical protein [Streptococcus gallolyticus]
MLSLLAAVQAKADDTASEVGYYTYTSEESYRAATYFIDQKQALVNDVQSHIKCLRRCCGSNS